MCVDISNRDTLSGHGELIDMQICNAICIYSAAEHHQFGIYVLTPVLIFRSMHS